MYSSSLVPHIILLSVLMVIVCATLFYLTFDLLQFGCVAWHRESVGYLVQAFTVILCLLITTCNLMSYIKALEMGEIMYNEGDQALF